MPTQVHAQSMEEAEREGPHRARGSDAGAGIHEESGLGEPHRVDDVLGKRQ